MVTIKLGIKLPYLLGYIFLLFHYSSSQKTCPNCGSIQVPYPLSTRPNCGDPEYTIRCDPHSQKLYFNGLNESSYLISRIMPSIQRMVVQPSGWLPGECVTQDMPASGGLWLNHTLPFNITSSNTIFLLNCSPRLFLSPLNCTSSSLCHGYLEKSRHVDKNRAMECASSIEPCCTFIAGGMPSAYKIRLHRSGCRAFRSILHLDPSKPADQWEEGLEIQWAPPQEPVCKTHMDCSKASKCSPVGTTGLSRCLCYRSYYWNSAQGTCLRKRKGAVVSLSLKLSLIIVSVIILAIMGAIAVRKLLYKSSQSEKDKKATEDMLRSSNGEKSARMFRLKDLKKATNGFAEDRILGSGGYGEVYKGELEDGTIVAVKSAKVGNIKSTQHVLNEVGILSQVNHNNLVRLLGCCVEAEQPLMVYEYISNGTLYDHLHGKFPSFLEWKTRLRIAQQTAEALAYIHFSVYTPIYHRDVKSTNILLDDDYNAKVSDFGLSRLAQPGLSHVSTCAQGTVGYVDPEYYRNYQLTDKSDVYSYGVVLLELLTSMKAIDFFRDQDDVNLAIYASHKDSNGTLMEIIDQRLLGQEPSTTILKSIKLFSELAFACLKEKKRDRPCMRDVVQELLRIIQISDQEEHSNEVSVQNE